jgi:hypothetical protein
MNYHEDDNRTANDYKYIKLGRIICYAKTSVRNTGQKKRKEVVIILRVINAARSVMYLLNGRIKDVLAVGLF